jgi:hypothetical protein
MKWLTGLCFEVGLVIACVLEGWQRGGKDGEA